MQRWTLRRRLNTLLVLWFVVFLVLAGSVVSVWIERLRAAEQAERMLLARTIASSFDAILGPAMQNIGRLPARLGPIGPESVAELRSFRLSCPFRSAVYVVDGDLRVLAADPSAVSPLPPELLSSHVTVTSLYEVADSRGMLAAVVHPFMHGGEKLWLVAEIDPSLPALRGMLPQSRPGDPVHVLVVDARGTVITADRRGTVFARAVDPSLLSGRLRDREPFAAICEECEGLDAEDSSTDQPMVVAPLGSAPWAVIVMQHGNAAIGPLVGLGGGVFVVSVVLAGMGLLLSVVLTRSVVSPITRLSRQAEVLRDGDLVTPIEVEGDHEIALLSDTLDAARRRLSTSMRQLEDLNRDLEEMVANRTARVVEQYRNLALLHEVAQECVRERKIERLAPRVLELFAKHYELESAALEVIDEDSRTRLFSYPAESAAAQAAGVELSPGWAERPIAYLHQVQGRLLHPRRVTIEDSVMTSLEHQLAVAIHGARLWGRTLRQDSERRVLLGRLLHAGEEERKRIARELHDEIAQLLTVIQLSLEKVEPETSAVRQAQNHLQKMQREIRRIIHDLRPSAIDDLGLPAAIESHAQANLAAHGIDVGLEIESDLAAEPAVGITLFRIFQEIVTNVLRHSSADHVSVELYRSGGEVTLAVEDDGVGFDPGRSVEGAGLVGIRERAALVGGTVTVDSEPNMGTHIVVRIPTRQ
jgi:signal transduction histidine kinase